MTLCQLLALADQHQAAQQSGGNRTESPAMQTGPGLLELARL